MQLKITFDISDRLREILCGFVRQIQNTITEGNQKIMSAIGNLEAAVTNQETVTTEGFALMDAALAELKTDIEGIPGSDDVQAATDKVVANTAKLQGAFTAFSTAIKDAIPTPEPE